MCQTTKHLSVVVVELVIAFYVRYLRKTGKTAIWDKSKPAQESASVVQAKILYRISGRKSKGNVI